MVRLYSHGPLLTLVDTCKYYHLSDFDPTVSFVRAVNGRLKGSVFVIGTVKPTNEKLRKRVTRQRVRRRYDGALKWVCAINTYRRTETLASHRTLRRKRHLGATSFNSE